MNLKYGSAVPAVTDKRVMSCVMVTVRTMRHVTTTVASAGVDVKMDFMETSATRRVDIAGTSPVSKQVEHVHPDVWKAGRENFAILPVLLDPTVLAALSPVVSVKMATPRVTLQQECVRMAVTLDM